MDVWVSFRVDKSIKDEFQKIQKKSGKGFLSMSVICRSALIEFINSQRD